MLRAENFARRGLDVNGIWQSDIRCAENSRLFLERFYDDMDAEIFESYWKYKGRDLWSRDDFLSKEDYIKASPAYCVFKEAAVRTILLWNAKVLSGEFVPLLVVDSKQEVRDYPGMRARSVYYGPSYLRDDPNTTKNFIRDVARKKGIVAVAHEIVNPEAIDDPAQLAKAPHIHWELEYVMMPGFGQPR
jgi:hypothetical protein